MEGGVSGVHVLGVHETTQDFALLNGAPVGKHLEGGTEGLKLLGPVREGGLGGKNEEGTPDTSSLEGSATDRKGGEPQRDERGKRWSAPSCRDPFHRPISH